MKHIFLYCIISLLLPVIVYAQVSDEYINPRLAMSSDGQILAISGRAFSDTSARLGVRYPIDFYDANTGILINSFDDSEDSIQGLTLNSDGSLLAYSNGNGRLAIVDIQTASEINIIVRGGFTETGYPDFGPDDNMIASFAVSTVQLYDTRPPLNRLSNYYDEISTRILGLDWSNDSNIIAYSTNHAEISEGILVILEVLPNNEIELLKIINTSSTLAVAINDNGDAVATATNDGVLITSLADDKQLLLAHNYIDDVVISIDWSDDGTKVVAGGYESITIWNTQASTVTETISVTDLVMDVFFSPDGEYIYHTDGSDGIYRDGLPLQEAIAQSRNSAN